MRGEDFKGWGKGVFRDSPAPRWERCWTQVSTELLILELAGTSAQKGSMEAALSPWDGSSNDK